MGEISATMTKKKKKKGRPSLLDLQKRSLKQQQQQQNPNFENPNSLIASHRRSTRRNPTLNEPDWINGDDDDDDDDERKQKKHKLLLGLNSQQNTNSNHHYPFSSANSLGPNPSFGSDGANPETAQKRRKISDACLGSDDMVIIDSCDCFQFIFFGFLKSSAFLKSRLFFWFYLLQFLELIVFALVGDRICLNGD